MIRIIGDPILHRQGQALPTEPTAAQLSELKRQVEIAKAALIAKGGVGIAANQCAEIAVPFQFAIVGVYHDLPEHIAKVLPRYADVQLPEAELLINPTVISASERQTSFRHGCLSVPSRLRGYIHTPAEMTVTYLSLGPTGELVEKTRHYTEVAAVVLQHELNHILHGKTYIDCCLQALAPQEVACIEHELHHAEQHGVAEQAIDETVRPDDYYCFVEIHAGHSELNLDRLRQALSDDITAETLAGMLQRIQLLTC